MSDGEKDRFGDKLRDAEKGREEQFFADRDRELLQKLKAQSGGHEGQTVREVEKPTSRGSAGWLARILGRSS